jgi:hypothetical protein
MANWWELWSQGLQALGGIVELIGAGLLAFEWWRGVKDIMTAKMIAFENPPQQYGEFSSARQIDKFSTEILKREVAFVSLSHQMYRKDIVKERERELSIYRNSLKFHARLYVLGFVIVILGVIFQVSANGIAWAGARGLFS